MQIDCAEVGSHSCLTIICDNAGMGTLIKSIAGLGLLLLLLAVLHAHPFAAYPFGGAANAPERDFGKPKAPQDPDLPFSPWRRSAE